MAQLCARHLAQQMQGEYDNSYNEQWGMKAVIGTAVHAYVENKNTDPAVLTETRLTIGDIPGYGTVTSTSDQFHIPSGTVGDLKTTERKKLDALKSAWLGQPSISEGTVQQHINQVMLYGLGFENAGYEVNRLQITYLCRDGGDLHKDIWTSPTIAYERERALYVFDRAKRLWAWLEAGNTWDVIPPTPDCFNCDQDKMNVPLKLRERKRD